MRRQYSPYTKRGPYKNGDRAFLVSFPLDMEPTLLSGPRLYRAGTVQMSGPNITWILFDDGEQTTVKTRALNSGNPPEKGQ